METLKGTWRFNDVPTAPSANLEQAVNFTIYNSGITAFFSKITASPTVNNDSALNYYWVSNDPEVPEITPYLPITIVAYSTVRSDFTGWNPTYGESLKTITFTTEQEVSDEFYTWFTANATEVVEGVQISGVWKFKDVLTAFGEENQAYFFTVNFSAAIYSPDFGLEAVAQFDQISTVYTETDGNEMSFTMVSCPQLEAAGLSLPYNMSIYRDRWVTSLLGYTMEPVKTIDFGTEPQTVSEDFYTWLTANATQPTASVQYNGQTIANLFGGQTATLKCKGDNVKMLSDIVVKVAELPEQEESGGLAINGIIEQYEVNAGATVNAGDFVEFISQTNYGSGNFHAGIVNFMSACKLDEKRVLLTYQDSSNSSYGTAVVLSIEDNVVSIGAEFVFSNSTTYCTSAIALAENKVLVLYQDGGNSHYGTAAILSIADDVISIESNKVFNSSATYDMAVAALTDSKVLVAYRDGSNSECGTAVVLTIDGTSVTAGTKKVFESAITNQISLVALSEAKALVSYRDEGNSKYGTAIVLTISGTTVSTGSPRVFQNNTTNYICSAALSESKVLVTYYYVDSKSFGAAVVLSVSGTTITKGTAHIFASHADDNIYCYPCFTKLLTESKGICVFQDGLSDKLMAVILSISDTTVSSGELFTVIESITEQTTLYDAGIVLSESSVVVFHREGQYVGLLIDETTIALNEATVAQTFIEKATSRLHNVGVAATSGAEGETVDVYVVG